MAHRCTPKHDVVSLVADMVTSFSFHERLTGFGAMPHAALPAVRPPRYNSSKTYVAIVRSDGESTPCRSLCRSIYSWT